MSLSRRGFLAGVASAALIGCARKSARPVAGGFIDDGGARGHLLRDGAAPSSPTRTERTGIVIVGGGIAGLSAAWRLQRRGFDDFVVLELEQAPGGNARWGENEVSAFPWGAHYVPIPEPGSAPLVHELFEELGVLRGGAWDEMARVLDPEDRLFRWGEWRTDLVGALAETRGERAELRRLDEVVQEHRSSGEFTIPTGLGAPRASELDRSSFRDWLEGQGFREPALLWYADYVCRDDYGATAGDTSAWAGIHYFASRAVNETGPLTWPEGNGWIVRRLVERLGAHVRTGVMVHRVEPLGAGVRVLAEDADYLCEAVVWAAPSFLAPRVIEGAPAVDIVYSPWVTANLTLDRRPRGRGAEPAWDNVIFDSASLGYVVANHQGLSTHRDREVWTWYLPVSDRPPADARRLLLERRWEDWRDFILADLERGHPDIRQCVSRIDVLRLGHAMARPVPGFLSSGRRAALRSSDGGPIYYANSDLSGLSLFEEAQHHGVAAADRALERIGRG